MADLLWELDGAADGTVCRGYEEDGKLIIVNEMPKANVMAMMADHAEREQLATEHRKRFGSNGGLIGQIPSTTRLRWRREWEQGGYKAAGIPWNGPPHSFLARKMRDRDYSKFRLGKL